MGFNGEFPIIRNGQYIGNQTHANFPSQVASLKQGRTLVNRVEFGVSGSGSGTFNAIKNFYTANGGFGPNTQLYKNFQVLRQTFPTVDAINNNDEDTYDVTSTVAFMQMLSSLGFQNTVAPFEEPDHWRAVATQTGVSSVYLQVYDTGRNNNPCSPKWQFGVPVILGFWNRHDSPIQVENDMYEWQQNCGINMGFMWIYDDFAQGEAAIYANAISLGGSDVDLSATQRSFQTQNQLAQVVANSPLGRGGCQQSPNCLAVQRQFEDAQQRKRNAEANVVSAGTDFNRNARASEGGGGSVGDQQQLRQAVQTVTRVCNEQGQNSQACQNANSNVLGIRTSLGLQ